MQTKGEKEMNNTITIILDASGSIANVKKDFSLYQGQYQSKLLDILVPTSILAPKLYIQFYIGQMAMASTPTDTELDLFVEGNTTPSRQPQDGDVVEFYNTTDQTYWLYVYVNGDWTSSQVESFGTQNQLDGTAVKVGLRATQRNGIIYESEAYYVKFLKTTTIDDVDYALYERELPYVFTKFAGQGQNAPQLVCNVINVDIKNQNITSMITTQTCGLDVMPSSTFDNDIDVEYDVIDEIEADINTLAGNLELKQDKEDIALQTTSKNIVGAINEVNGNEQVDRQNITYNSQSIADLDGRVTTIEENVGSGYTFIGTLKLDTMPTQEQLSNFVVVTAGREPRGNDVISFVLLVSGGTDKNYKYTYSGITELWSEYEIPATEPASNTDKGIVQGSYDTTQAQSRKTQVNIVGGEIKGIYLTDNNGTQQELANYVNNNAGEIDGIKNGSVLVGMANNSNNDGAGHNIELTYMTRLAGASKQYVQDYALPRVFNDVSFLGSDNLFTDIIPSTQSALYTANYTGNILDGVELFYADKYVNGTFQLANKNSYTQTLYISSSVNIQSNIRMVVELYDNGSWVTGNVELTEPLDFVANTIKKISLGSTFNYLNEIITVTDTEQDKIRITVEALPTEATNTTFSVWSNETYPSTFYLNTTSQTIDVATGYLGEIKDFVITTGTLSNNILDFDLPVGVEVEPNTLASFTLTYNGTIPSGTKVRIRAGLLQVFQIITSSNFGTNDDVDISDFDNFINSTSGTSTTWKFVGLMQEINSNWQCFVVGYSPKGIVEITTPTNIWELENGVYKGHPSNFRYGIGLAIDDGVFATSVIVNVGNTGTSTSRYYCAFSRGSNGVCLISGLASASLGNKDITNLSRVIETTSVVDNLTSTSTTAPLSANQGKILNENKQATYTADNTAWDTTPTANSTKPVTSNGIYTAISTINSKIPNEASSSNQLADKNYVNDAINQFSAYYITKNAQGDPFATKAELTNATVFYSGGSVRVPTTNDYCIVLADESKQSSTGVDPTTRYSYQGNQWEYQYTINDTPLTAAQLAAINSGITSTLVGQITTNQTDIANKMDKANPTGTGSLSINRKANTTVGLNSVAVGNNTTASGQDSFAEGSSSTASGSFSHAEGSSTGAYGRSSHAEGELSTASGDYSHAEGYGVLAPKRSQHVFGEYNTTEATGTASTRGTYVEIVGNGTASDARSNARTLDWDGNEVLAGTLQTTGLKDGNNATYKLALPDTTSWTADKTIATKEYVDDIVGDIETLLTALNSGQGV